MEEKLMEERKNMLLDLMKDPTYVPMKLKELAMLLGVTKEQRGELEEVLNELVASGKVGISKKGNMRDPRSSPRREFLRLITGASAL